VINPKIVYDFSDEGLVKAIEDLRDRNLRLTEWERNFVTELGVFWITNGGISWKQRRAARTLLASLIERANRAAFLEA
jgi:hypothetical protein